MKKIKKVILKALLLSMIAVLCISLSIDAKDTWRTIYTEDFAGDADGAISSDYIPEQTSQFEAKITDEALSVKSDNICYMQFNDISSVSKINGESNSHGVELQYHANIPSHSSNPYIVGGCHFEYNGGNGDASVLYEEIAGKKAVKMFTYVIGGGSGTRTNILRWVLDPTLFRNTDNNFEVEIEYYMTPSDKAKSMTFGYKKADGSGTSKTLSGDDIETDKWMTWKFDVTDANFSQVFSSGSDILNFTLGIPTIPYTATQINSDPNFYDSVNRDPEFATYIHSVKITKKGSSVPHNFTTDKKTVQIPLDTSSFGDSRITFDMLLPNNEPFGTSNYNAQSGAVRVSLANENKLDVATVEVENTENEQKIYTVSTDSEGIESKEVVYTGNILDKNLTYALTTDWIEKTYTLSVKEGDTVLVAETEPCSINNLNGVSLARYLSLRHSHNSFATMSVVDNIKLECLDAPEYFKAKEDVETLVIDELVTGQVASNFTLPLIGEKNASTLSWETSNSSILELGADGAVIAHPGETDEEVDLTVTSVYGGVPFTKVYHLIVSEHVDHKNVEEEVSALSIPGIPETFRVKENFTVPTVGSLHGATITWTSNNSNVISVSDGKATVNCGEFDDMATLTATVTIGNFSMEKEFVFTVPGLSGVYATVGEVVATETDNKLTAEITVTSPGRTGNLTFAAMSVNALGDVVDVKYDTKNIVLPYSSHTFSITDLKTLNAETVKYYLWDDNGISIINNAPTDITDLKASGKGAGIILDWTASKDDNNAISRYAIYRDDTLVDQCNTNRYIDRTVNPKEYHSYKVIPIDTNDLTATCNLSQSVASTPMYYIDFEHHDDDKQFMSGMGELSFLDDPARDRYAFFTEVEDVNGNVVTCASSIGKMILARTNKGIIKSTDKEIAFEVTFFDNDSTLKLLYNGIIPAGQSDSAVYARRGVDITTSGQNTRTWKTEIIKISDAQFRESNHFSNGDFGVVSSNGKQHFVRIIKLIQTPLYE